MADTDEGIQVLDLATLSKPVIIASYKTAAPTRDIAVAGAVILVVVGGNFSGSPSASQTSTEVALLQHTP